MTETMWIRSHVERCLQQVWQMCELQMDEDGDYPFRDRCAAGWVALSGGEPSMVRVWAYAATGVKKSAKLLEEVNAIQLRALSASIALTPDGFVIVKQTISPVGLTSDVLVQALAAVGGVANDVGPMIAAMFGGSTPYPVDFESIDEDAA